MKVRVALGIGSNLVARDVEWSAVPRPGDFITPGPTQSGANFGAEVTDDIEWCPLRQYGVDVVVKANAPAESVEEAERWANACRELGWKDWSELMKGIPGMEPLPRSRRARGS